MFRLIKKKKSKKAEETLAINLGIQLKNHDTEINNYQIMKARIHKFTKAYKAQLTTRAYIHGTGITLYLKKEYYTEFPDGFLAYADKLGLTVEPICNNGFGYGSSDNERSFVIRAKSK